MLKDKEGKRIEVQYAPARIGRSDVIMWGKFLQEEAERQGVYLAVFKDEKTVLRIVVVRDPAAGTNQPMVLLQDNAYLDPFYYRPAEEKYRPANERGAPRLDPIYPEALRVYADGYTDEEFAAQFANDLAALIANAVSRLVED